MEKPENEKTEWITFSEAIMVIGVVWSIAWVLVEFIKAAQ